MKRSALVGSAVVAIVAVGLLVIAGGGAWYWFYGPCGKVPVGDARRRLTTQSERWSDALQIAASTPMLALAGPLSKLQDVRRETKEMLVPDCAAGARDLLSKSMEHTLAGFLAFMGATSEEREAMKTGESAWAVHAKEELEFFRDELARLETCPPRCGAVDWDAKRAEHERARHAAAAKIQAEAQRRQQEAVAQFKANQAEADARAQARAAAVAAARKPTRTILDRTFKDTGGRPWHLQVTDTGLRVVDIGRFIGCWDLKAWTVTPSGGARDFSLWLQSTDELFTIVGPTSEERVMEEVVDGLAASCEVWHKKN